MKTSYLTKNELAKLLNISIRHVDNLVKRGTLPGPVKLGRSSRWNLNTVEEMLNGKSR
ncbi:MAG: excisionase family DNA binding protein [Planctomycetaceae bacterium]|jgi:excisionase family DNA binding protein